MSFFPYFYNSQRKLSIFSVFTLPPRCGLLWNALAKKKLSDELNGSKIHRLENDCGCWFSKSIRPIKSLVCSNCASELTILDYLRTVRLGRMKRNKIKYKLESPFVGFLREYQEYVTFTTPDPVKYPVPSRTYLDIHAAGAKLLIFQERVSILTSFTEKWRRGRPLTSWPRRRLCRHVGTYHFWTKDLM